MIKKHCNKFTTFFSILFLSFYSACGTASGNNTNEQGAPAWLINLEKAYPGSDWVAVTAQGNSQPQAESGAMNALARAFRTDVASLTSASQQFTQIITNIEGSRNISFDESSNFSHEVNTSTNIHGLIGVQIDVYRDSGSTVHVCARMNRKESAARYTGMIRENTAIINTLLAAASSLDPASFDVYARLSFACSLAQITDNFQNILEVLDPSSADRRPAYGGAAAIKVKMMECASLITIGIAIDTGQQADRTLLTRAAGSFFRDLGFRVNEQAAAASGQGNYLLRANARF